MPPPDLPIIAAWLLAIACLYLYTQDRLPYEAVSLGVLLAVLLALQFFPVTGDYGTLRPADVFGLFGHEVLVTVASLVMLARALEVTGALSPVFGGLAQLWLDRPRLASLATLAVAAALSAFISNTQVVTMLMPVLVGVAISTRLPPSQLLMPMGFAAIVGGMATVIGASTNVLAGGVLADHGVPAFGLFDFIIPVALASVPALLYLWLVAPRLLPARHPPLGDTAPRVFSAVLRIEETSAAAGLRLPEVLRLGGKRMRIDRVQRGENLFLAKLPSLRIQPGDRLHVRDLPDNLKRYERALGATLSPERSDGETGNGASSQQLAEIVVTRGSLLHRRTLAGTRLAARYRLLPLAIHRARGDGGETVHDLDDIELRAGDVLLVQGSSDAIEAVRRSHDVLVLDGSIDLPHTERAGRAIAVVLAVIGAFALGLAPVAVCALAGVAAMLAFGCLRWRDLPSALNTRLILMIAVALALALVLQRTGAAPWLGMRVGEMVTGWQPWLVLGGLMGLTILLTNLAANAIVAAVAVPFAIALATTLGAPVVPFVLAALFGASMSFIRPAGYQGNLLLVATGGYRPADFAAVGTPLALILWIVLSALLGADLA